MPRRLIISVLGVFILTLLILLSAQVSYATPPDTVGATLTAVHGRVAGTATAIKQHVALTETALYQKVAATATALKQNIAGTATAIHSNIAGTATEIRDNVSGTLTAIAPTVQSYHANLDATVTALYATITAVPQNVEATLTAFAPTLVSIQSTLALTPIPGDQAAPVLTTYAAQTYGTTPTITKSGGADYKLVGTYPLPQIILNAQSVSANLAAQTYIGQTANGVIWLFESSGTVSNPATSKSATVQGESLGIYTQYIPASTPLDVNSALALAKTTYPALASASYSTVTISQGYAFYSATYTYVVNPANNQMVLTPESIVLTVVPGANGKAYVTAAVGTGIYSTALHQ